MPLDRIDIQLGDDEDDAAKDDDQIFTEAPIEPGSPSPENTFFVLLGVAMALAVVARLVMVFG